MLMERLLPKNANNDYQGNPIAFWGLCLLLVPMSGRSLIHPLTEEFYLRTPPGKALNLPFLMIAAMMLTLSLRRRDSAIRRSV